MTTLIGLAIHKTMGMRVTDADERSGIDVTEHAETAYELAMVGGSFHPGEHRVAGAASSPGGTMAADPVREAEAVRGGVPQ
jgi:Amt family ammonium transporter